MVKLSISEPRIIECLRSYYGMEVTSLTALLFGADMNASVYKAQTHEKSYFVKVKVGHNHDIGVAILDLLQSVGIQQIIPLSKHLLDYQRNLLMNTLSLFIPILNTRMGLTKFSQMISG